MMKHITLLAAACLCSISAFSTRYLVQTGLDSDAKWTRTLQEGEELIDLTEKGKKLNEVYKQGEHEWWLAAGDYEITASMNFVNGVKIYGGFAGTETNVEERAQSEGAQPWEFGNSTILDGKNTIPVFGCSSAPSVETILDGVTVQNGNQASGNGGGMTIRNNCYVRNCRFLNNTASNQGGAIICNGGGTVEDSYFSGNNATLGGACHIAATSSITGCLFENNTANNGGAIRSQATDGTIANCIIRNNTATANGSGIYTQSNASANKIINCLIYGNQTKVAVYMRGADIINCTVDGGDVNSVYVTTAGGKIINSVFTTPVESALTTGVEFMNNAYASIKGNDEWTNSNNKEITNGEFGFTDAASGDYTLASTSQLINAGTDIHADYASAATDLIGTTRPQGTAYDLGAYECPYYTIKVTIEGSEYGTIYDDKDQPIATGAQISLIKGSTLSGYITINEGYEIAKASYTNAAGTEIDLKKQIIEDATITGRWNYTWTVTEDMDIKVVFQTKGSTTNLQANNINPFRCMVNNGMLQVSGLQLGETISIYNIAGSKVAELTASDSNTSVTLQQGIYLVRAAGQTKKIILN